MPETKKGSWGKMDLSKMKIDFLKEGRLDRFLPNVMLCNAHQHEKLVKTSVLGLSARSLNPGPLQIAQLPKHQPGFILTTFTISLSVETRLRDHLNR